MGKWYHRLPFFSKHKSSRQDTQDFTTSDEKAPLVGFADAEVEAKTSFGGKDIGFIGGFALLLNNITGPGMVNLPVLFQNAGWVTPIVLMLITMVISSFSATMICKAMSLTPGNSNFQGRVEIGGLAKLYFPKWLHWGTIILLVISLQATNISSIIVSAQTADFTLIEIFKWSAGLEVYPDFGFDVARSKGDGITPFGDVYLLSLGYILVLVVTIPMGYLNLDDNIFIQVIAVILMLIITFGVWMTDALMVGLDFSRVPAFTDATGQGAVLGTIIFNYAFVTAIPSWVNEKKEGVSINKSIWSSTITGTTIFIIVGLFAGWAFQYDGNENILDVINDKSEGNVMKVLASISVYMFPVVVLLTSIPVFGIIIRYNLVESGLMGKHHANFWAILFPWIFSIPFYTGSGLSNIIAWVGLFVNGIINFVVPIVLYLLAMRQHSKELHAHHSTIQYTEEDYEIPEEHFDAIPPFITRFISPIVIGFICVSVVVFGIGATIIVDLVLLIAFHNNIVS